MTTITSRLSRTERNSAAISANRITSASRKFCAIAAQRLVQVVRRARVGELHLRLHRRAHLRLDVGPEQRNASSSVMSSGGSKFTLTVRCPLTRTSCDGPTVWRSSVELADRLHARRRRHDRQFGQLLGRAPLARLDDDVEPLVAVEVLAGPEAARERAHRRRDLGPRETRARDAPFVGDELQLGLVELEARGTPAGTCPGWPSESRRPRPAPRPSAHSRSAPWKSRRISRALLPSTLSSDPRCTNTGVSGKPTMISSRSSRTISWMSRGSAG